MTTKQLATTPASAIAQIAEISRENNLATLAALDVPDIEKDLRLAAAMGQLRQLISGPVLQQITQLAGTKLGFVTDRDRGKDGKPPVPYPDHVIRDAAIEALVTGARLVGNEINVISGQCYLAKNYYRRMLSETVSNLRIIEGAPEYHGQTAFVPMSASFTHNGTDHFLEFFKGKKEGEPDLRIQVRVNSGMGPDAVSGKAFKKLAAKIYAHCTQTKWLTDTEDGQDAVTFDAPRLEQPAAPAPDTQEAADYFGEPVDPATVMGKTYITPDELAEIRTVPVDPETGDEIPNDVPLAFPRNLKELRADLAAIPEILSVHQYCHDMESHGLTEKQKDTLEREAKRRCDAIRGQRGERTNGKDEA